MLESFLALLRGEKPGEVVWTGDLDYWMAGQRQAGIARAEWDTAAGRLRLHRELDLMPYLDYETFWAAHPQYDGSVEVVVRTDGDATLRCLRTPLGELREESVYSRASCSTAVTRHAVKSKRDLDILRYVLDHRRLEPSHLADYRERAEIWRRYDGLPCIGMPRSGLASLCYEWAGLASAVYLIADHEGLVREILQRMEAQEEPILEALVDLVPPLVHFPDNLSSQNLSGLYDDFMGPGHRRRIERLHKAGVKCAVHLDGTVRGLLPKLIAAGFDAIEAITPKPGGDLEVEEICDLAGDSPVILWGGVPGVLFAPPFTWPDMRSHVLRVLASWGRRPFVLGIADQVPPNGDITFCRKIAELVQ
jgi:hypothetical protein